MTDDQESRLREQRDLLVARYDGGAPAAVFSAIRQIEIEISWLQHRGAAVAQKMFAERAKQLEEGGAG
jgi:hypothetical protein